MADVLEKDLSELNEEDIKFLVNELNSSDGYYKCNVFNKLNEKSELNDEVYPYINTFFDKLKDKNSQVRNIGLILVAANAKWDTKKIIDENFDFYLSLLKDEKPITALHCLKGLHLMLPYKEKLWSKIINTLTNIDILFYKETMRKVLMIEILNSLNYLKNKTNDVKIINFFQNLTNSNVFNEKTLKEFNKIIN
jgi:hypothetical protein